MIFAIDIASEAGAFEAHHKTCGIRASLRRCLEKCITLCSCLRLQVLSACWPFARSFSHLDKTAFCMRSCVQLVCSTVGSPPRLKCSGLTNTAAAAALLYVLFCARCWFPCAIVSVHVGPPFTRVAKQFSLRACGLFH